jgi:hypothetical protein
MKAICTILIPHGIEKVRQNLQRLLNSEVDRRYRLIGAGPTYEVNTLRYGDSWVARPIGRLAPSFTPSDEQTGVFAEFLRQSVADFQMPPPPHRMTEYTLVRELSLEPQYFDPMRVPDLLTHFAKLGVRLRGPGSWTEWAFDEEISTTAIDLHSRYGTLNMSRTGVEIASRPAPPINLAWFGYECLRLATALEVHNSMQTSERSIREKSLRFLLEFRFNQHRQPGGDALVYLNSGDLTDDEQFGSHTANWLASAVTVGLEEFPVKPSLRYHTWESSGFSRGFTISSVGAALWLTLDALILDGTPTQKCAYVNCPHYFTRRRINQDYCHHDRKREGRNCKRNHDRWAERQEPSQ